jgi:archaellum component FlaC
MKNTLENTAQAAGKEWLDTLRQLDDDITKLETLFNNLEHDFIQLQADYTSAMEQIESLKRQIKP